MIIQGMLLRTLVLALLLLYKISNAQVTGQNFVSLYSQLQHSNLIMDKNSPSDSTYIQVETYSALCKKNGEHVTHMDQLMPLIASHIQPKRRGNAYYIDTATSSLRNLGITIRTRVLQKKNNPNLNLSSTLKFNIASDQLSQVYQQKLENLNSSTYTSKIELGLGLNSNDTLDNFQLSVTHKNIRQILPSFMQTVNIPRQFYAYRSNEQNFISFSSLSSNLPLFADQTWFLNQVLETSCHEDYIKPYQNNLGIRAGMQLNHWERKFGPGNFIELDIEERKLFFPQNKNPYYVVSYKVKAQKTMDMENLTRLLALAVAHGSSGNLKACSFTESFEDYLYTEEE